MRTLAAAALALCASCVTASDLQLVSDQLAQVEAAAIRNDGTLEGKIGEAQVAISAVADDVKERTEGFIKGVGQAGEGGILGILAAVGVHLYRNSTRKRDLAQVKSEKPPTT